MEFNILSILEYIEEKIESNEKVNVRSCSQHFNYSYYHFSRLFKQEVGVSMSMYISAMKMEKSIEILLDPKNTVTDAYTSVQYQSPSSFSRNFKKYLGLSPKEYKKKVDTLSSIIKKLITNNHILQLDYYSDKVMKNQNSETTVSLNIKINIPIGKKLPVIYVGLYKSSLALGNALVSKILIRENKCSFGLLSEGEYNLLVSGIEDSLEKNNVFTLKNPIKGYMKIEVLNSKENNIVINLHEPKKGDPPIVINCSKLLEDVLNIVK